MKYIKIPADQSKPLELIEEHWEQPYYKALMKVLNGGYGERVRIGHFITRVGFDNVMMYVDEDGLAKDLPFNVRAGYLYGTPVHNQPIVGDAYLFGEEMTIEGADIASIPDKYDVAYWETLFDSLEAYLLEFTKSQS